MQSSAKNRCEIEGASLLTTTRLINPMASFFLSRAVNPLAHNKNKYGEIGSPWLYPLDGIIVPLGSPLLSTEKDVVVTHIIISEIHFSLKPIFRIIDPR